MKKEVERERDQFILHCIVAPSIKKRALKRALALLSAQNMHKNIGNTFGHKNIDIFSEQEGKMSAKNERERTQKKKSGRHL